MKRTARYAYIPSLVLCASIAAPAALGSDWPMWRNSATNAAASAETINLPLTPAWHSTAPGVEENGAVISNGVAYMSANDGHLYAFTVTTGIAVAGWPVATASSFGTPAVDAANGKVYQLAGGTIYAFNLNGSSAWSASVGSLGSNYNEGPIVEPGFVYFKAGGNLLKYSSAGAQQWSVAVGDNSTQPAIAGSYVYSNSGGQIRRFDKSTGVEATGSGYPITVASNVASVTVADGFIFYQADQLYAYNVSNGTLAWSKPCGGSGGYTDSPAVSGGAVYAFGFADGALYAFDEATGATLTGFPTVTLDPGGSRNYGSPSVAGDKVFVGAGTSQKLRVVGAAGSASAGQVLNSYDTFSADTQGFDLCSPLISDGWVLAMLDGGGLYAFYGAGVAAPQGGITINSGDACTTSANVTLTINRFGDTTLTQMIISEDPFFTGASYEAYAATKPFTLSAGFGLKTVYAKLKTAGGTETNVFSDTIDFEATCGAGPTPTPPPTSTPTPTPTPVIERAVPVPTLDTRSLAALALVLATVGVLLAKRVLK